jgi:hypothetical protein
MRFIYSHDGSAYSAAGKYVDRSWEIAYRHMNLKTETEAVHFPEKKYIIEIFVAVHSPEYGSLFLGILFIVKILIWKCITPYSPPPPPALLLYCPEIQLTIRIIYTSAANRFNVSIEAGLGRGGGR